MKTTDLTPGVIYAEQRSSYGTPTAVVFVDTTTPVRFAHDGGNRFTRAPKALLPDLSATPAARAYLVVTGRQEDVAKAARKIANLTIDALTGELEAAEKKVPKGLALSIARPRDIKSTWDDHVASERRNQEARERAEVRRAEEASLRERQEAAITDALQARGVSAGRWSSDVQFERGAAKMDYDTLIALLGIEPVK